MNNEVMDRREYRIVKRIENLLWKYGGKHNSVMGLDVLLIVRDEDGKEDGDTLMQVYDWYCDHCHWIGQACEAKGYAADEGTGSDLHCPSCGRHMTTMAGDSDIVFNTEAECRA